ncbi:MAG TPA: anti-sigma regulatory factor [Polyangiales bacterium]|nr:anti-sigma regulatory factor [Polyangiales bacterium]
MSAEKTIPITHESDIVAARRAGRELASQIGFTGTDLTLIATAISEVARNIVSYAKRGEVVLGAAERQGIRGISIVARDEGPGIADINLALQDGYSTAKSLGLGLPGARRLMDDFEIDSAPGRGTTVTMHKWVL